LKNFAKFWELNRHLAKFSDVCLVQVVQMASLVPLVAETSLQRIAQPS